MSYNGIGLQTAKGSSTNGYIQKNYTRKVETSYQRRQRNKQSDLKRDQLNDTLVKDRELIKHEDKRKLELKVSEFRDELEDLDELNDDEIEQKCKEYRESLLRPLQSKYKSRSSRSEEDEDNKSNKDRKEKPIDY